MTNTDLLQITIDIRDFKNLKRFMRANNGVDEEILLSIWNDRDWILADLESQKDVEKPKNIIYRYRKPN